MKIIPLLFVLLVYGCAQNHDSQDHAQSTSAPNVITDEVHSFSLEDHDLYHRSFEKDIFARYWRGDDEALYNFLNVSEFWNSSTINRDGPVTDLPLALHADIGDYKVYNNDGELKSVNELINNEENLVDAMIVLHRGKIAFEKYNNMNAYDKHLWFSVTKTLAATAVAILEDRGLLDSKEPVERYLPDLRGTAWEGVAIVDILDMCPGIDCYDIYGVKGTCFSAFMAAYGWPTATDAIDDPMEAFKTMKRHRPAGEVFEYGGVNTYLLSHLVEEVSGQKFTDFFEQAVWQPMGAEADALMVVATNGKSGTAFGMNSSVRDLARYGLLFTPTGQRLHPGIISNRHLAQIQKEGRPYLFDDSEFGKMSDEVSHNAYQWDYVMSDGDFYKMGSEGQGLYISTSRDLVIAYFGHGTKAFATMPGLVRQLAVSEFFNN